MTRSGIKTEKTLPGDSGSTGCLRGLERNSGHIGRRERKSDVACLRAQLQRIRRKVLFLLMYLTAEVY